MSSMSGSENLSLMVILFSNLWSIHSLNKVPSFFRAITIPAAYGLELIRITFFANMVRNFSQTFDRNTSVVHLDRMLTVGLYPLYL